MSCNSPASPAVSVDPWQEFDELYPPRPIHLDDEPVSIGAILEEPAKIDELLALVGTVL